MIKLSDAPAQLYQGPIPVNKLVPDSGQEQAVQHLNDLFETIAKLPAKTDLSKGMIARLLRSKSAQQTGQPKGIYLYGGVGRGKTMLMDLFAQSILPNHLQRFHFHDFMVAAQNAIQKARLDGAADPIDRAAQHLIEPGRIICFDEMEVRDIADAMIIKRLFDGLWARGMILVTTSNRQPDDLYLSGLHRDRFLPFIEALKERVDIYYIGEGKDWRSRVLQTVSSWYVTSPPSKTPDKHRLDSQLDGLFVRLSDGKKIEAETIMVAGRSLKFNKVAGDLVDLQFDDLCRTNLGARDYLVLADRFAGLMMRNIPIMGDNEQNEARRFMWLVDALYDRGRFIIASAAAPQESIYTGHQWAFEFARTCSRLKQMAQLRGMRLEP